MKSFLPAWVLVSVLLLSSLQAEVASFYRPFSSRDGKVFQAFIESKTDIQVNFRLANGKALPMPISQLSDPDQMFVRKWSKFRDDLQRSSEFARLTVRDLLEMLGYQSFEFDIEGNHIFVEGLVSSKAMKLMVDTGSSTTLFHDASAQEAGLKIGAYDQEIFGVAGKQEAAVVEVQAIKLGDAQVTNRKYLATDLFKFSPGQRGFDGILGADFLREWDAVISYREGRMFLKVGSGGSAATPASDAAPKQELRRWNSQDGRSFYGSVEDKTDTDATFLLQNGQKATVPIARFVDADQDLLKKWSKLRDNLARRPEFKRMTVKELLEMRNYQSFQYRMESNHIFVDGMVNEAKARFMIDTGAHGGVLHSDYAVQAKADVGPYDQWVYGIGGKAPAAKATVTVLRIGDVVLSNRSMLAADLFKDQAVFAGQKNFDAIFGADFLRELDGVVNYKESRIFLRPDISDKTTAPVETTPAPGK